MAKHYKDAVAALHLGHGDALDASYPGGIYDVPELQALSGRLSGGRRVPLKPGQHRLVILEHYHADALQKASDYLLAHPGQFELIGATPTIASQLHAKWPYESIFLTRVTLQARFNPIDLSAVAAACALRFARGGLQPFVAPDTQVAVHVAQWAPGGAVVHLRNVPPDPHTLPRPHVIGVPGKPATGPNQLLTRTGQPEVDAFIAARELALAQHPKAQYIHMAGQPIHLHLV